MCLLQPKKLKSKAEEKKAREKQKPEQEVLSNIAVRSG